MTTLLEMTNEEITSQAETEVHRDSYRTTEPMLWYAGSTIDKAKITIGLYNTTLENATWHYTE